MGIESERQMALHRPLGEDVLLVRHLHGAGRLSSYFEYTLILYSEDATIRAEALLGKQRIVVCSRNGDASKNPTRIGQRGGRPHG